MEIKKLKRKEKCRRINKKKMIMNSLEGLEVRKSPFYMDLLHRKLCKIKGRVKCQKPSKERVIKEILGDAEIQKRLFAMGLLPNTRVNLLRCHRSKNSPLVICLNGHHIMLDCESSKYVVFKEDI